MHASYTVHEKRLCFYNALHALQSGFMVPVAIIGERIPLHSIEKAFSLECIIIMYTIM